MKTKDEIVDNWLPRYTGNALSDFGEYILLTNFSNYVNMFADWNKVDVIGKDRPMQCATAGNITIINFGMGSPGAATIMDLLTAINPKAVLFLGKCGGLKRRNKIGDLILPIAAIRGEGTSNDYLPAEVPALPAFALQKAISTTIRDHECDYWTGVCYTTNRRVWEHDESFKEYLKETAQEEIKELKNIWYKEESGSDNDRNYCATDLFSFNTSKMFGDIEVEVSIIGQIVSAYYEGASLDFAVEFNDGAEGGAVSAA